MLDKPKRFISEEYLEFIRHQPCCNPKCDGKGNRKSDPHHTKSVKSGGSDLTAVPLCRECHSECHNTGIITFQVWKGINFFEIMESLLRKAIEKGIFNKGGNND
jgi:hypothetical protein